MRLSVELIRSDTHGNPVVGGPDGHFVGCIDVPPWVAPVDQMHAGGAFPDEDCADAVTEWALALLGISRDVAQLEPVEGTRNWGTGIAGVVAGFASAGVASHVESGPMEPGWLMQPSGGLLIAPPDAGAFVAASQGVRIVVDAQPAEQPMTPAEQQAFAQLQKTVDSLVSGGTSDQYREVEFAYMLVLGRTMEPGAFAPGPDGRSIADYWRDVMNQGSWEAFITELAGTTEGQTFARTGVADIATHPGAVPMPRPPAPGVLRP